MYCTSYAHLQMKKKKDILEAVKDGDAGEGRRQVVDMFRSKIKSTQTNNRLTIYRDWRNDLIAKGIPMSDEVEVRVIPIHANEVDVCYEIHFRPATSH